MKFNANWRIEGIGEKGFVEPGEVVEAKMEDVADMVAKEFGGTVPLAAHAVLTPVKQGLVPAAEPDAGVDLAKLKKDELIVHAAAEHGLTLDPALTKPELIAKITEAKQAEPAQ